MGRRRFVQYQVLSSNKVWQFSLRAGVSSPSPYWCKPFNHLGFRSRTPSSKIVTLSVPPLMGISPFSELTSLVMSLPLILLRDPWLEYRFGPWEHCCPQTGLLFGQEHGWSRELKGYPHGDGKSGESNTSWTTAGWQISQQSPRLQGHSFSTKQSLPYLPT